MTTVIERLGRRWCEVVTAVTGVLVGAVVSPLSPPRLRGSVDLIPVWQAWPISVFFIIGGLVWLYTIVRWFDQLTAMWQWKRLGSGLSGLAWLAYSLSILMPNPLAITGWVTRLAFTAMCWGTLVTSYHSERRTRSEIRRRTEG